MRLRATESMKGSRSSAEANESVRQTVAAYWPDACVVTIPVSDGGEGFLDAVAAVGTWQRVTVEALDPLMRPIRAQLLIRGRTAVVEMAQASGLGLLKAEERSPLNTTTYGTGQLIAEAVRRGAEEIVVGLGGSATSDCGRGALLALNDELGEMPSVGRALYSVRFPASMAAGTVAGEAGGPPERDALHRHSRMLKFPRKTI